MYIPRAHNPLLKCKKVTCDDEPSVFIMTLNSIPPNRVLGFCAKCFKKGKMKARTEPRNDGKFFHLGMYYDFEKVSREDIITHYRVANTIVKDVLEE